MWPVDDAGINMAMVQMNTPLRPFAIILAQYYYPSVKEWVTMLASIWPWQSG
jgi:hypothetical protein